MRASTELMRLYAICADNECFPSWGLGVERGIGQAAAAEMVAGKGEGQRGAGAGAREAVESLLQEPELVEQFTFLHKVLSWHFKFLKMTSAFLFQTNEIRYSHPLVVL